MLHPRNPAAEGASSRSLVLPARIFPRRGAYNVRVHTHPWSKRLAILALVVVGCRGRATSATPEPTAEVAAPPLDAAAHAPIAVSVDWKLLANGSDNAADEVAVTADGSLVVLGHTNAALELGPHHLEIAPETSDGWVALVAPDGTPTWLRSLHVPMERTLALGRDGTIWVAVALPHEMASGALIALSAKGEVLHRIVPKTTPITALAMASGGDLVYAGPGSGNVDAGGGPRACGRFGFFVARIHPNGKHVWSTCAHRHQAMPWTIAVVGDTILVGGSGGHDSDPEFTQGVATVVAFEARTGSTLWTRDYAGSSCVVIAPVGAGALIGGHGSADSNDRGWLTAIRDCQNEEPSELMVPAAYDLDCLDSKVAGSINHTEQTVSAAVFHQEHDSL